MTTIISNGISISSTTFDGDGIGNGYNDGNGNGEGTGEGTGIGNGNGYGNGTEAFARRADDPLQALTTL